VIAVVFLFQYIIAPANFGNFLFSTSNAVFYNPALISDKFHFSAIYGELYSIPGLNFFSSSISFKRVSLGAQVVNEEDFYVNSINLGYSFPFQNELRIGISGELKQLFVENKSEVTDGFGLGAGFVIPYSTSLVFGFALHNVLVTDKTIFGPGEIALSSKARISGDLTIFFDALYDAGSKVSYRLSLNYKIWENLKLMGGLSSTPASYYLGLTFRDFIKFSYSTSLHPYLGLSHFVELRL